MSQERIDEIKQQIEALREEHDQLCPPAPRANICLGVPFNWCFQPGLMMGLMHATQNKHNVSAVVINSGCLPHGMNCTFHEFFNGFKNDKFTHFGMIHSDMRPDKHWIDTLIEEMDKHGADFISAAARIKDDRNLTNMGVQKPGEPNTRRITMTELFELPETFSVADTIYPDYWPAFNTGACLVKAGPWMDAFEGFRVANWFTKGPDGDQRFSQFYPEDWGFTSWLHTQGCKVMATRKVRTWHTGLKEWGTDRDEGTWNRDQESVEWMDSDDKIIPSIARKVVTNGDHDLALSGDDSVHCGDVGQQLIHACE